MATRCTVHLHEQEGETGRIEMHVRSNTTSGLKYGEFNCDWTIQGERHFYETQPNASFTVGNNCIDRAEHYCLAKGTFDTDECTLNVTAFNFQENELGDLDRFIRLNCIQQDTSNEDSQDLPIWAIVVAVLVSLLLIAAWIMLHRRNKNSRGDEKAGDFEYSNQTETTTVTKKLTDPTINRESLINPLYGEQTGSFELSRDEEQSNAGSQNDANLTTLNAAQCTRLESNREIHNYEVIESDFKSVDASPNKTCDEMGTAENQNQVTGDGDLDSGDPKNPEKETVDNVLYNL